MNGKGDKPRPTDLKKYRNNYDTIFSKKKEGRPMLDCYKCKMHEIYTPLMGELVGNRG